MTANKLHHQTLGEGAPVVLFVQASPTAASGIRKWQRYARQFRVFRCDLRGFGRSPVGAMPITYAADVAALLDELGIRSAALVGCSLGGRVALGLAVARPDLVSALVLVGAATPEALAAAPELQAYASELMAAIAKRDLDGAVEGRTWVDGPHRTPDRVDAALRAKIAGMQRDAFITTREVGASWRERPLVSHFERRLTWIAVPTLVLVGELDMAFVQAQAELFRTQIPEAEMHILHNTAHAASAERPEAFDELVIPFLVGNVGF